MKTAIRAAALFTLLLALGTTWAQEPETVLLLHFEEGQGVIAADSGGLGHDGVVKGATWAEGRFGRGLHFSGQSRVDLGRPDKLQFGKRDDFTVELWFRLQQDTPPDFYYLLTNRVRADDTAGYTLVTHRNMHLLALVGDKVSGIAPLMSKQPVNDGQWHHAALSCDRDGEARLYLDGQLQGASSMAHIVTVSNEECRLLLGSRDHKGDLIGDLDEVRFTRGLRTEFALDKPYAP